MSEFSDLTDFDDDEDVPLSSQKSAKSKAKEAELGGPEAEGDEEAGEEEITEALARPPPVNSEYLPLPWKRRLGYVSTNTRLFIPSS